MLALTLQNVSSKHPLIVFVPEEFEATEKEVNMDIRKCASIVHEGSRSTRKEYQSCLNKLYAWSLLEYEKVCWLDCDMLIIHNIDDVFQNEIQLNEMLAAPGCTCNIFNNPKLPSLPWSCPFRHQEYIYVNTGIFVIRPSQEVMKELQSCDFNHPLPDQDAFNIFFRKRIRLLDPSYNFMVHLSLAHPDLKPTLDRLRVIHFTYDKPWLCDKASTMVPFAKDWQAVWRNLATRRTVLTRS